MNVSIIKYNAGNIQSVINALNRIGINGLVTDDPETIRSSDKVIFPGVGEAGSAMRSLRKAGLDKLIPELGQPVLGICVGMQLLCKHSEESDTACLDIIPVSVRKFDSGEGVKVPQMGWNTIYQLKSPLFEGIEDGCYVYNVHSYYVEDSGYTIAKCEYGIAYAAAIQKENFFGVQFHTEKSAAIGDRIIKNFINL